MLGDILRVAGKVLRLIPGPVLEAGARLISRSGKPVERDPEKRKAALRKAREDAGRR
jgi:hypothetical protein